MLGDALAYPFALLIRRPATVLVCLFLVWLLLFAVDLSLGQIARVRFVNHLDPITFALRLLIYHGLRIAVTAYPWAIIGVYALVGLRLRDAKAEPNLADALRFGVVSLIFLVAIQTPINVAEHVVRNATLPPDWGSFVASLASNAAYLLIAALIYYRFAFWGPHLLANRRVDLAAATRLTFGHYLKVVSVLLPIEAVSTFLHLTAVHYFYALLDQNQVGVAGMLFDPAYMATYRAYVAAFIDLLVVLQGYIFFVASILVYQRIAPASPSTTANVF